MWKISKIAIFVTVVLATAVQGAFAQPPEAFEAFQQYREGNFTKAEELINKAVVSSDGEKNSTTWHIRGFIYKDIYTQVDLKNPESTARKTAIESLLRSKELDKSGEHEENNTKALRFLATSYYNDAVLLMRELNMTTIHKAEEHYLTYKSTILKFEPEANFKERDIDFYKALSTSYRKIYDIDRENRQEYLTKAQHYLDIVLEIDPDNYGALYNKGVLEYNEGASRIESMDPEAEIPDVVRIQAVSIENFERALPYMIRAYELNPTRPETLKGLRGIYHSLSEDAKADEFNKQLQQQEQKKPEDNE